MTNMQELFTQAREARFLRNQQEISQFDAALAGASPLLNNAHLKAWLLLFEDSARHVEVMDGLRHLVEQVSDDEYIPALIAVTPDLRFRAAGWLKRLYASVLNNADSRTVLIRHITHSPAVNITPVLDEVRRIAEEPYEPLASYAREVLTYGSFR
jgi:hypothetical protein